MRKALFIAAGLAFIATSASSQSSSRDRDDDNRRPRGDSNREWRDRDDRRGGRSMWDDNEGGSRAARFVLRSGDSRLAVSCDDRESMRACVDAALTMFDKVRAQQGTTSSAPATSAPASPPSR